MTFMQVEDAAELIRLEYAEMPSLQLTFWQAQRLWNLSTELCERALAILVRRGFLMCTAEGRYIRTEVDHADAVAVRSLRRAM